MPKIKKVVKSAVEKEVKREVREDLKEMLIGFGFKREDMPSEQAKKFKGYVATYVVKIKAEETDRTYVLICSVFDDGIRFAVMDNVGIIKLCGWKSDTPTNVLSEYIVKAAKFFRI